MPKQRNQKTTTLEAREEGLYSLGSHEAPYPANRHQRQKKLELPSASPPILSI